MAFVHIPFDDVPMCVKTLSRKKQQQYNKIMIKKVYTCALPGKAILEMLNTVSGGTLNSTNSLT